MVVWLLLNGEPWGATTYMGNGIHHLFFDKKKKLLVCSYYDKIRFKNTIWSLGDQVKYSYKEKLTKNLGDLLPWR